MTRSHLNPNGQHFVESCDSLTQDHCAEFSNEYKAAFCTQLVFSVLTSFEKRILTVFYSLHFIESERLALSPVRV